MSDGEVKKPVAQVLQRGPAYPTRQSQNCCPSRAKAHCPLPSAHCKKHRRSGEVLGDGDRDGDSEGDAVSEGVEERDGVTLDVGVALGVTGREAPGDRVAVFVGVGERDGETEGVVDAVRDGDTDRLGVRDGVRLGVTLGEAAGAALSRVVWATKYCALMGTITDQMRAVFGADPPVGAVQRASATDLALALLCVTPEQPDCSCRPALRPVADQDPTRVLVLGPAKSITPSGLLHNSQHE